MQVGIAGGTESRVGRHRGWNGPSGQDSGPQRAEEQSSTNGLTKVRQHIYSIEMTIVIIISPLGSCMALLGFASQSPTYRKVTLGKCSRCYIQDENIDKWWKNDTYSLYWKVLLQKIYGLKSF